MITRDGLRLRSSRVRTAELHPEMLRRLQWVFAHPRLPPGACLSDVVRVLGRPPIGRERWGQPVGSVWYYWSRWTAGIPPLAANPTRIWTTDRGFRGVASTHCVQETGYSYAADFAVRRSKDWPIIHDLGRQVGLDFPLRKYPGSPEPWHCQMAEQNWAKPLHMALPQASRGFRLSAFGVLRRGAVSPDVRVLQELLREAGYRLSVDGCFGPVTERTVRRYQRDRGLTVDGVVGPQTWGALGRQE